MSTDAERVAWVEASIDKTPVPAGVRPNPGQLWYKMLCMHPTERLGLLARLIEDADTAVHCFAMDHVGRLEQLEARDRARAMDEATGQHATPFSD